MRWFTCMLYEKGTNTNIQVLFGKGQNLLPSDTFVQINLYKKPIAFAFHHCSTNFWINKYVDMQPCENSFLFLQLKVGNELMFHYSIVSLLDFLFSNMCGNNRLIYRMMSPTHMISSIPELDEKSKFEVRRTEYRWLSSKRWPRRPIGWLIGQWIHSCGLHHAGYGKLIRKFNFDAEYAITYIFDSSYEIIAPKHNQKIKTNVQNQKYGDPSSSIIVEFTIP